jgi:DNA repair protein RadD
LCLLILAYQATLYAMPTGGGKTVMFAELARRFERVGLRILIVVHRRELVRQTVEKLARVGVVCGVIASDFASDPSCPVQVGMAQTLARHLDALPELNLIILDEAHHCRAEQWEMLINSQPQARLLGVTATPARLDGKGLDRKAGGFFDVLVIGPEVKELTAKGYLSPARCFVPERQLDLGGIKTVAGDYDRRGLEQVVNAKIIGDATLTYFEHADHQPAIAYCISIQHAEATAEAFRQAGYRSASISGKTPIPERDALIAGLGDGTIEVLTSCDLISEGLDVPVLGGVILLRPTKSLVLHRQQIGRGMRPSPGKVLVVLDHVSNCMTHGLPDAVINWTLDGGVEKTAPPPLPWRCAACGCLDEPGDLECQEYGAARPSGDRPRAVTTAPGALAELTATEAKISRLRCMSYHEFLSVRRSEFELREFAAARGYNPGWVWHQLQDWKAADLRRAAEGGVPS